MTAREKRGFTITELAIVLLVIGFLFGGVIKGSQITKQARLRRQAKEISSIVEICELYFDQYGRLPGDNKTDGKFDANTYVWEDLESEALAYRTMKNPYGGTYTFLYGPFSDQEGNYVRTTLPSHVAEYVDKSLDDGGFETGSIRSSENYRYEGDVNIVHFIFLE
jgi:prepilin-type N-terminal cleavage/methylation domain-containing protein